MPASFGNRVLDAPWLRSGPTARVLELLNGDGEEARVTRHIEIAFPDEGIVGLVETPAPASPAG